MNMRKWHKVVLVVGAAALVSACDSLLNVELPGRLDAERLEDPALLPVLEIGMMAEIECGLMGYALTSAAFGYETMQATQGGGVIIWNNRILLINQASGDASCTQIGAGFLPMHTARVMGEEIFALAPTADRRAIAATVAAYATTILGEGFCEMTMDGGSVISRAQTFQRAEEWFTMALDEDPSAEIVNLALVGRARARLNLGDGPGAVADASQVPQGFVRLIETSTAADRRVNRLYEAISQDRSQSVTPQYRDLMVDGEVDVRFPTNDLGVLGDDNITPIWEALRYPTRTSPFVWASWREAQLIIAEVEGGQTAVGIINDLRANVAELPWVDDSHPGLPPFASNDPVAIADQVLEERRRELALDGHRLGDLLRLGLPFETGLNHKGEPFGPLTCIPLPDHELDGNPNA